MLEYKKYSLGGKMKYNASLAYLFSPKILNSFFELNENSNQLQNIIQELGLHKFISNNTTFRELFENTYIQLLKNYRNEYVFKNAIAQKILIGRHSIKSSSLFTELRVETSKADIVIFNGTSHVYEIKTDLDNFERLEAQIENYKKVFEYVNIVSVESKVETIQSLVDNDIGIIILTDKYTLSTVRKAKSRLNKLDKQVLFNMLRKDEYLKIIKNIFGYIPDVPNTKIYSVSKELFITLSVKEAHKEVLKALKTRKNHKNLIENIKKFPDSLKIAIIEADLNIQQQQIFLKALNTRVKPSLT